MKIGKVNMQDIDVDVDIPFGRKNYNTMAVVMATEQYEDGNYLDLKYAKRDGKSMRNYFQNSFGLSDFQILPSKPWQMEGGPSLDDLVNTFADMSAVQSPVKTDTEVTEGLMKEGRVNTVVCIR